MIEKIKKSSFLKNTFFLVSGTSIAQLIPILISPLLTRMYAPESFGVLMVYVSFMSIMGVVATARYEKSIIIPVEDEKGKQLTILTQGMILLFCTLFIIVNLFFGKRIFQLLDAEQLIPYSWLLIIGVLFLASDQTYYHWANRKSEYKKMSFAKVTNNMSSGIVSIVLGLFHWGALGLILSKIVGLFSSLIINLKTFSLASFKKIDTIQLKNIAKEYKKYPLFLMPGQLMNAISLHSPPILLAMMYSEVQVGFFALTHRVIMLPVSIISRSVGDVFRQQATEKYNTIGNFRPLYLKTIGVLFLVGLIPFSLIIFFAPFLFSFVFGVEWSTSGEFAQLLAILFLAQFVTSPVTNSFVITDKLHLEFVWQILFLFSSIVSIVLGFYLFENIKQVLFLFAVSRAAVYLLSIFLTLPYTIKKKK